MFFLQPEPIDIAQHQNALHDARSGACATFEGRVRNHNEGRLVTRLAYEAFDALAVREGARIIDAARARFEIHQARCVHRVGVLEIGECAVWIGVSAAHRDEAFQACRFMIDEIKHRLPIWKKEHYADGDAAWVNCQTGANQPAHALDALPAARGMLK